MPEPELVRLFAGKEKKIHSIGHCLVHSKAHRLKDLQLNFLKTGY